MKCIECDGIVDWKKKTYIKSACGIKTQAGQCSRCGRLHHSYGGTAVFDQNGDRSFVNLATGELYNKPVETEPETKSK